MTAGDGDAGDDDDDGILISWASSFTDMLDEKKVKYILWVFNGERNYISTTHSWWQLLLYFYRWFCISSNWEKRRMQLYILPFSSPNQRHSNSREWWRQRQHFIIFLQVISHTTHSHTLTRTTKWSGNMKEAPKTLCNLIVDIRIYVCIHRCRLSNSKESPEILSFNAHQMHTTEENIKYIWNGR